MDRTRFSPWRPLALGLACLASALPAIAIAQATAAPSSAATTRPAADDLYAMSPTAFSASEPAGRAIDPATVDSALLAVAIFHETNRVRAEHQLPALTHGAKLDEASAMHARDMIAGDFFAHENPNDPARRTPMDRAKLAGYDPRYVAENLATHFALQYEPGRSYYEVPGGISYDPRGRPLPAHTYATFARSVLVQWMNSPGHRANIVSKEPTQLGTAALPQPATADEPLAKFMCVQVFGTPMPTR